MSHDPPGIPPDLLRRYPITVLPPGDPRRLLLPEDVAELVDSDVVPAVATNQYLGAVFVDDQARPLAFNLPYLGYMGNHRVEPSSFLMPAYLVYAEGLILFHQRGARAPAPARREVRVARRVLRAGELAGPRLLDYLVLGDGRWLSLGDAGKIAFPTLGASLPPDGRAEVKPKYRNPEQPRQTWSGRGKMARWLREKLAAGAELEDFAL